MTINSLRTTISHIQNVKIELEVDLRRAYRLKDSKEIKACSRALAAADQIIERKRREGKCGLLQSAAEK